MPAREFRPAALLPAFQCESTVGEVVRGIRAVVPKILVVDDGSGDGTAVEAATAGADVLRRDANGGKGASLRDGLHVLLREPVTHVAFLDADGQHDPADLDRLLAAARDGADFVIGSRLGDRGKMPARSYWANTIGDRVLSRLTGLAVEDGQSGYRVVEADLLRRIRLVSRRFAIENEILVKAAPRVRRLAVVPVRTIYGPGRSHYRPFRDTWITSWLTVWYKTLGGEDS
jgi:glycosyltransferase involved in cell wall biosynthesis